MAERSCKLRSACLLSRALLASQASLQLTAQNPIDLTAGAPPTSPFLVTSGEVVYPSSDITYMNPPLSCAGVPCQYACTPFANASPPYSINKKPGMNYIMLIDRGPRTSAEPCYFISKVYNAQLAGADAVSGRGVRRWRVFGQCRECHPLRRPLRPPRSPGAGRE